VTKHEEYSETLTEQCEQKIHYIFLDIEDELDNIEEELDTESSKILMSWVRNSIQRIAENYKI
jgi:c-di-AMP phosphodiesterase-like protein